MAVIPFSERLTDMRDTHMMCRDLGHSWGPHTAAKVKGGFERTLRCRICNCLRYEFIDTGGTVMARQYTHDKGYLMAGLGRMTPDQRAGLRVESVNRSIKGVHYRG